MVDDDVAQGADRVVEVAAVLDAEALGHRDLDGVDVVAVPDRLEHRVREPEVEDLLEAHLPEEVVDPVELRLVDVLVQLGGQRARRVEVVAERLLDDHSPVLGQAGLGQAFDDRAEQEGRDLEVEDRGGGAADRVANALVGRGVTEVARHVGEPRGERSKVASSSSPGAHDRLAGPLLQLVVGPVVDGDADDRAVEEPARLEPVERAEGHHLRQVAGDPEHDQDVGGLGCRFLRRGRERAFRRRGAGSTCHLPPPGVLSAEPSAATAADRHPGRMI